MPSDLARQALTGGVAPRSSSDVQPIYVQSRLDVKGAGKPMNRAGPGLRYPTGRQVRICGARGSHRASP